MEELTKISFTIKSRSTSVDWDHVAKTFRKVLDESDKIYLVEGEWGGMDDCILIISDGKSSKEIYRIIQESIKTLDNSTSFYVLAHHPRPRKYEPKTDGTELAKCHEY
jgi:hypothetical protein